MAELRSQSADSEVGSVVVQRPAPGEQKRVVVLVNVALGLAQDPPGRLGLRDNSIWVEFDVNHRQFDADDSQFGALRRRFNGDQQPDSLPYAKRDITKRNAMQSKATKFGRIRVGKLKQTRRATSHWR